MKKGYKLKKPFKNVLSDGATETVGIKKGYKKAKK